MARLIPLALLVFAVACSPQPAAEAAPTQATPQRHPASGLVIVPLSITSRKGTHRFRAEVAISAAEQQKGMMFRTSMAPNEAMIFPNPMPQNRSFWMKNTVIPLDIIYVGPDRKIVNIVTGEPYSTVSLPSDGPVINVVEIPGGRAAELGIKAGDRVTW